MEQTYKHACIKPGCANVYVDDDPDAYYCETCNEERKRIAIEVDKKIGMQPKERQMSDLEIYDSQAKVMTSPTGRTISFAPTKL